MLTDIMFSNGDFVPQSQIFNSFQIKTNYLNYHRVVNYTKIYLHKTDSKERIKFKLSIFNQIRLILKLKTDCKDFYHVLKSSQSVNTTHSSLAEKQQVEINANMWEKAYNICFNTIQKQFKVVSV